MSIRGKRLLATTAAAVFVATTALGDRVATLPPAAPRVRLHSNRERIVAAPRPLSAKGSLAVKSLATNQEILDALFADAACQAFVTGVTVTATDPSVQVQVFASYGNSAFSGSGSVLVLSSGNPANPEANCCTTYGVPAGTAWGVDGCPGDTARVDIDFNITDANVRSMAMEFDVYSYEYPSFVGAYNDFAFAYWDETITVGSNCLPDQVAQYCPNGLGCAATTSQTGGLVTFDNQSTCQPTMVNNAFFSLCSVIGCDSAAGVPGWETAYSTTPGDLAGRTGVLSTTWPVTSGTHRLTLIVGDVTDSLVDSAGVFARLRCSSQASGCASTQQQQTAENVPALSLWGLGALVLLVAGLGAWRAFARG